MMMVLKGSGTDPGRRHWLMVSASSGSWVISNWVGNGLRQQVVAFIVVMVDETEEGKTEEKECRMVAMVGAEGRWAR